MLDPAVRFDGFDTDDWTRLGSLLRPREPAPAQGRQGLIMLRDGSAIRKVLAGDLQPVALSGARWPMDLAEVAKVHGAPWVVVLEVGALEALMDRLAAKSERGQDALDQILLAWGIGRALVAEERVALWPAGILAMPVPTRRMVLGAMSLVCPPGQSVVLAAWSGTGELWTSLGMRRGEGGFDALVGPIAVRERMARGPSVAKSHEALIEAMAREVGPVAVGISAPTEVWEGLAEQQGVGGWARVVGRGAMRLDPFPRTLAVPLAVDATRMAYGVARSAVGRLLAGRREADGGEASGAGPLADLLEVWGVVQGLMRLQRRQR